MPHAGEISRRDFLKCIPKNFMLGVHLLTEELRKPADFMADGDGAGTVDVHYPRIAEIDTGRCLAWEGGSCQLCYLACPLRDTAIMVEDQRITIDPSACDGCGKCMTACQTVNTAIAIRMITVKK